MTDRLNAPPATPAVLLDRLRAKITEWEQASPGSRAADEAAEAFTRLFAEWDAATTGRLADPLAHADPDADPLDHALRHAAGAMAISDAIRAIRTPDEQLRAEVGNWGGQQAVRAKMAGEMAVISIAADLRRLADRYAPRPDPDQP